MRHYRCYFLNESGSITAIEPIECFGDDELLRVALKMLRARPHHYAIEAWDGDRQVLIEPRSVA
jgi:hypothetical protein